MENINDLAESFGFTVKYIRRLLIKNGELKPQHPDYKKAFASSENRLNVIRLRDTNPCATLQYIADSVGLTRERVRQILKEENKPTKKFTQKFICNQCGNLIKGSHKRLFCSISCRKLYRDTHPIEMKCSYCENVFKVYGREGENRILRNKSGKLFCSNRCKGKYLAKNYGFGVSPENYSILRFYKV